MHYGEITDQTQCHHVWVLFRFVTFGYFVDGYDDDDGGGRGNKKLAIDKHISWRVIMSMLMMVAIMIYQQTLKYGAHGYYILSRTFYILSG